MEIKRTPYDKVIKIPCLEGGTFTFSVFKIKDKTMFNIESSNTSLGMYGIPLNIIFDHNSEDVCVHHIPCSEETFALIKVGNSHRISMFCGEYVFNGTISTAVFTKLHKHFYDAETTRKFCEKVFKRKNKSLLSILFNLPLGIVRSVLN